MCTVRSKDTVQFTDLANKHMSKPDVIPILVRQPFLVLLDVETHRQPSRNYNWQHTFIKTSLLLCKYARVALSSLAKASFDGANTVNSCSFTDNGTNRPAALIKLTRLLSSGEAAATSVMDWHSAIGDEAAGWP
jgi:hypothetical protein